MNNQNHQSPSILFIDSGVGGLTTLSETTKILMANYIYFADNKFAPYGNKSDDFLKSRLSYIISSLSRKFNFSIVVLACNTATTTSISFLRKKFPRLLFVGTEPAIKTIKEKNYNHPALIATPQTINHLNKNLTNNILLIPLKNFASQIENHISSNTPQSRLALLKTIFSLKYKIRNCDCLILGCTHYSVFRDKLSKILNTPIIDGNHGVAKQICRLFQEKRPPNSSFKIILSDKNKNSLQNYKKILRQILANQINLC